MKNEQVVYEFRPLPDVFVGDVRRYANGEWIPDDGEYDLAFIGTARGCYPVCLYFQKPYYENLVCSWLTTHWTANVKGHPHQNPWHYATKNGKDTWGEFDNHHANHPNSIAGTSGSNKMAHQTGCCNGKHVEFKADDPHIAAGLVRNAETKEVFSWPEEMTCVYCSAVPPVYASELPEGQAKD